MVWNSYNNYGAAEEGSHRPEMVYGAAGAAVIMSWEKWMPIVMEQRVRYMGPNYMEHWEYIATVMKTIQERRGIAWEPPKTGFEFHE